MKKLISSTLLIILFLIFTSGAFADKPTREEIISKVKDAAMLITEKGQEVAFKVINNKEGKFTWKGTYVFAIDFDGIMLARSFRTDKVVGKSFLKWQDKSNPPKYPIQEMIELAMTDGEGWIEYMYPKPGGDYKVSLKKISYIYKVSGHDMFVGAGIYE
ncbi:MAG: cache domain-containing protein [Candidatus Sedimenticola sp. 20ELBAFRAG]